jgi:predicted nucleic acid-binding protein
MAAVVLADAGFIVAFLNRHDAHNSWALSEARRRPPPWRTCEAVVSDAFHLVAPMGAVALDTLLRRRGLVVTFHLDDQLEAVLRFMRKYADVPASLADACLVRMTETLDDSVLLTTDLDFRIYRRLGRLTIPCVMP